MAWGPPGTQRVSWGQWTRRRQTSRSWPSGSPRRCRDAGCGPSCAPAAAPLRCRATWAPQPLVVDPAPPRLRSTYCVQGPATSPPGRFPSSPPGPNPAPLTPGPARRGQRPHGAPLRLPAGLRLRGQRLHRRLRQLPELVQLRGPGLRLPERLGAQVQEAGGYVRRRRGGLSGLAPGAGGAGLREAPGSPTPRGRVT